MNILYIMSDDHAANAISIYGSKISQYMKTPNIDSIGADGAVLHNCLCTNAICTPSRATILTGLYSHINGVRTLYDSLAQGASTFPQILQEQGYETAVIGKWHLHSRPEGFDHYDILGYPWQQGRYFDPQFLDETYDWSMELGRDVACRQYYGNEVKGYVTDIITDKAIDWLENRDKSKPFMLLCQHKAPHDEFEYHPRYEHLLDDVTIPEPGSMYEDKSLRCPGSRDFGITVSEANRRRNMVETMSRPDYPTGSLNVEGLDQEARTHAAYQKFIKDYLRTVKGVDDNVGRLLDYLKSNGLYEDTMIIYTSDQGMLLGEHDYTDKRWIFEESMQMPFLIRVPGEVTGGTPIYDIINNVDFAPTILDFAGCGNKVREYGCGQEMPAESNLYVQGRSFRQVLIGNVPTDWPKSIYYRYWLHMAHCDTPAHYGIRTKDYKLIFYYGLPLDANGALPEPTPCGWELYDLNKDPNEMENVYERQEYAQIVIELKAELVRQKEAVGDSDDKYPQMMTLFN